MIFLVNAYMEVFGSTGGRTPMTTTRLGRHSVHSVNFYEQQRYDHQISMFHLYSGLHRAGTMPATKKASSNASLGSNSSGTSKFV